jgi:hypothetical protein
VNLSSTTAVKPTFTMPKTRSADLPAHRHRPGGSDVATAQISPIADVLTTTQVEFRTDKSEWRVAPPAAPSASSPPAAVSCSPYRWWCATDQHPT